MTYSQPTIHSVTNTGLTKLSSPTYSNSMPKSVEGLEITSSDLEAITKVLKEAIISDQVKSIELSKYPLKIIIQANSEPKEKRLLDSAHSIKKEVEALQYIPKRTNSIASDAQLEETPLTSFPELRI